MSKIELVVFNAVVAVVFMFAIAFNTVVKQLELFEIALLSSWSVSNAAGAPPTKFVIALLTYVWVAKFGNCDVMVELIFATDVFKVVKFVVCPLTVPNNEL